MKFKRCILQVCPVLPQDVQQQLLALEEAQLLQTAVTSFAYPAEGWLERLLRFGDTFLARWILDRTTSYRLPPSLGGRVHSELLAELMHQARRWHQATQSPAVTDAWFRAVDLAAARRMQAPIRLALGREDGCLSTFSAAKAMGSLCLYDLPIAHYKTLRQMMERELAEFPGAASHLSLSEVYGAGRCRRKNAEVSQADHILVASRYVADSLATAGVTADRYTVIPYGCEPKLDPQKKNTAATRSRVVLNVGHVSLRKGIPRLLRAWKRLGAYRTHRLRLIGSLHLTSKFLSDYASFFEHIPHLPRDELGRHYAVACAFVFPSACDGFGLVLNEALSYGLPVIASTNTGAPGFITDGLEGMIYPFGDDDKLCASLDRVLSRPDQTAEMGRAAYQLAQRWTWAHYRSAFRGLLLRLLEAAIACSHGTVRPIVIPSVRSGVETLC